MDVTEQQPVQVMSVDQLEDLAFHGAPLPNLKKLSDMLLFLSFRNLYDFAKRTQMTHEQGAREKAQILHDYKVNSFLEELHESTSDMWRRVEVAVAEYNKAPSIERADKVIEAIYKTKRKLPQEATTHD